MKNNDWNVIPHINKRYDEIVEELEGISSLEDFKREKSIRKATIFDLLQIGELLNHISKELITMIGESIVSNIIGLRNRIVHGYGEINDQIVYASIKNDLTPFIANLNAQGKTLYYAQLKQLIGQNVIVEIDCSVHSKHKGIVYELNYGFINGFVAPDGELQDAYIIDDKSQSPRIHGKVIGIVHRRDDIEDKLLVATKDVILEDKELLVMVDFQEQFFDIEIWR